MSDKIVVPETRIKAVSDRLWPAVNRVVVAAVCKAFAEELRENPIVPTYDQCQGLLFAFTSEHGNMRTWPDIAEDISAEWQRRMFVAPEPEIPEALADLIQGDKYGDPLKPQTTTNKAWDEAVLEAFRRGLQGWKAGQP